MIELLQFQNRDFCGKLGDQPTDLTSLLINYINVQ